MSSFWWAFITGIAVIFIVLGAVWAGKWSERQRWFRRLMLRRQYIRRENERARIERRQKEAEEQSVKSREHDATSMAIELYAAIVDAARLSGRTDLSHGINGTNIMLTQFFWEVTFPHDMPLISIQVLPGTLFPVVRIRKMMGEEEVSYDAEPSLLERLKQEFRQEVPALSY